MLPIDCIQSLACGRNAKHLFENEKQLHYSLIHLTCTVYVQVFSSSIDHCIVLEYVNPGDNVSATCCSVRKLVKNLMFFLNSFFLQKNIKMFMLVFEKRGDPESVTDIFNRVLSCWFTDEIISLCEHLWPGTLCSRVLMLWCCVFCCTKEW